MRYSLWDTEIGSRLGRFRTEAEALGFVRTMLATHPRDELRELSLNWRDDDGNVGEAIAGDDLLDLAEGTAERREPVKAGGGSPHDDSASPSSGDAVHTRVIAAAPQRGGE